MSSDLTDNLRHSKELDQLKSVWVNKHRNNELLVGGTVNMTTVLSLRKQAEEWIERLSKSYKTVVFNLEPSVPKGTICLSLMLCLARCGKKNKVGIQFINIPSDLYSIVELSGLQDVFDIASISRHPIKQS